MKCLLWTLTTFLLSAPILITAPSLASAQGKYLFVIGGAGDPTGPNTLFDEDLNRPGNFSAYP